MANQPRARLLALLLKLRASANAILLPANQTAPRFRYYARRFKELQGIINAIETQYPGEVDTREIERYGRNMTGIVKYLDSVITDVAATYSSGSTNSSSSKRSSSSSYSDQSPSSVTLSAQSASSDSTSRSSISSRSPSSAST
jgi:hypothetical protein